MEDKDWLPAQIKTIKNLCDTILILRARKNLDWLVPTQIEIMFEEMQRVVDEHCVAHDPLAFKDNKED